MAHRPVNNDFAPAGMVLTWADGRACLLLGRGGNGVRRENYRCPLSTREESDAFQIALELERLEWDERHGRTHHHHGHRHRHRPARDIVLRIREACA